MTDNNLFYVCSLIEFIGRKQKLTRKNTVLSLGINTIRHIYNYADIFHCEPIAKTADEYIEICKIKPGNFDNVKTCKYKAPSYWDIGKVYARLIQDIAEIEKREIIEMLMKIYSSWISDAISDFNTDFFYQPRDYIRECYLEGEILL